MQEIINGAGTRILFGILHPDSLNQTPIPLPPDVVIATAAETLANGTSLGVQALGNPVPAGSCLHFYPTTGVSTVVLNGDASKGTQTLTIEAATEAIAANSKLKFPGYEFEVTVTAPVAVNAVSVAVKPLKQKIEDAATGYVFFGPYKTAYTQNGTSVSGNTLSVLPLDETIPTGAIALHRGLLLLQGGTDAKEDIKTGEESSPMFGQEGGYESGVATSSKWSISYDAMALPVEPGFYRLSYAAINASDGVYAYVVKEDKAPSGFVNGERFEGICQVMGRSKKNPAKGSVTFSTTFSGREKPISTPPRK